MAPRCEQNLLNRGRACTARFQPIRVAAGQLGMHTRFSSLQLNGGERGEASGHGPGLSMSNRIKTESRVAGLNDPVQAYHRLFFNDETPIEVAKSPPCRGKRGSARHRTGKQRVRCNGAAFGKDDNEKLSEYCQSIRDIETRAEQGEEKMDRSRPARMLRSPNSRIAGLEGKARLRWMYDPLVAAFRIRQHPRHHLSPTRWRRLSQQHRRRCPPARHEPPRDDQRRKTGRPHKARDLTNSLAARMSLIDKLKATKEADGSSLFDHIALAYGSNICPPSSIQLSHASPAAERESSWAKNIVVQQDTPLCNAWLTLLHGVGVEAERPRRQQWCLSRRSLRRTNCMSGVQSLRSLSDGGGGPICWTAT